MSIFRCLGRTKYQSRPGAYCMYVSPHKTFYGAKFLAPRPTPKLEDHPLSTVRDCLFSIFAATLHIGGSSSIRSLTTRHSVVTGTHLSRTLHPCWDLFLWDGLDTCNTSQACCLRPASELALHVCTPPSVRQGPKEWDRET
jgi:hypothetical protein